jgi:hypothetical protein
MVLPSPVTIAHDTPKRSVQYKKVNQGFILATVEESTALLVALT